MNPWIVYTPVMFFSFSLLFYSLFFFYPPFCTLSSKTTLVYLFLYAHPHTYTSLTKSLDGLMYNSRLPYPSSLPYISFHSSTFFDPTLSFPIFLHLYWPSSSAFIIVNFFKNLFFSFVHSLAVYKWCHVMWYTHDPCM